MKQLIKDKYGVRYYMNLKDKFRYFFKKIEKFFINKNNRKDNEIPLPNPKPDPVADPYPQPL
jgi:hypothetical protein